jgi:hypothetical protein
MRLREGEFGDPSQELVRAVNEAEPAEARSP